jgi:hypothetical protein
MHEILHTISHLLKNISGFFSQNKQAAKNVAGEVYDVMLESEQADSIMNKIGNKMSKTASKIGKALISTTATRTLTICLTVIGLTAISVSSFGSIPAILGAICICRAVYDCIQETNKCRQLNKKIAELSALQSYIEDGLANGTIIHAPRKNQSVHHIDHKSKAFMQTVYSNALATAGVIATGIVCTANPVSGIVFGLSSIGYLLGLKHSFTQHKNINQCISDVQTRIDTIKQEYQNIPKLQNIHQSNKIASRQNIWRNIKQYAKDLQYVIITPLKGKNPIDLRIINATKVLSQSETLLYTFDTSPSQQHTPKIEQILSNITVSKIKAIKTAEHNNSALRKYEAVIEEIRNKQKNNQ